ncbi:Ankyrin-3 (ANK-3) (Ankyrin-G) [Durusdinium trenchii]|uniref:Ankyrin-3 (ANK-3) (Ankyrin-G) n=1 Tax=Durusdinium trenchii TaxID=1381693 RepID=A0ABP0JXV5_9DINO
MLDAVLDDVSGETALAVAVRCRKEEVVRFLLQAECEVDEVDADGWTALMLACAEPAQVEVARLLLEAGADANAEDKAGWTALMLACDQGDAELTTLLLNNGAVTELAESNGFTALMLACNNATLDVAQVLVDAGANLDAINLDDWSALMLACSSGCGPVVEFLLGHGAQTELVDTNGWTALALACIFGQPRIVTILVDHGVDLEVKDTDGLTPFANACLTVLADDAGATLPEPGSFLRCAATLFVAGAAVPLDKLGEATFPESREALADFVEFVESSPLARLVLDGDLEVSGSRASSSTCSSAGLTGDAQVRRQIVAQLFLGKRRTLADCQSLTLGDLDALGLDKGLQQPLLAREGRRRRAVVAAGAALRDDARSVRLTNTATWSGTWARLARMEVFVAIMQGDLSRVQELVEEDPEVVNAVNEDAEFNYSPLIWAVRSFKAEIAQFLIEKGADLDRVDEEGYSALMLACENAQPEMAKALVEKGANLDLVNKMGLTALMISVTHNQVETIELLVEHGAALDVQGEGGKTALMMSCRYDQPKVVAAMLAREAGVDLVDEKGWSALMQACLFEQEASAVLLIEAGANPDFVSEEGDTALMLALTGDQPSMAELLIESGANPNLSDPKNEWTPLIFACRQGAMDIAELLIGKGADLDHVDKESWTALMYTCRAKQPVLSQLLIEEGADLNIQDKDGWTALMHALLYDQLDTAKLMIDKGADVNITNNKSWTALMYACRFPTPAERAPELFECVTKLYAAGASLKVPTSTIAARDIAAGTNWVDLVAFIDFVEKSELASMLLEDLAVPRAVVVKFHEKGCLTLEDCAGLKDIDLFWLGFEGPESKDRFHKALTARKAARRRQSSVTRRMSQRLSRSLRRSTRFYDVFLSHDWGIDELDRENHLRVATVRTLLTESGLSTWFDADPLTGNVQQQVTRALEGSRKVVIFITQNYMDNLTMTDPQEQTSYDAFVTACTINGTPNMIPVVMEPRMLNTAKWRGPLQFRLASHLVVDFTTDDKVAANMSQLVKLISKDVQ